MVADSFLLSGGEQDPSLGYLGLPVDEEEWEPVEDLSLGVLQYNRPAAPGFSENWAPSEQALADYGWDPFLPQAETPIEMAEQSRYLGNDPFGGPQVFEWQTQGQSPVYGLPIGEGWNPNAGMDLDTLTWLSEQNPLPPLYNPYEDPYLPLDQVGPYQRGPADFNPERWDTTVTAGAFREGPYVDESRGVEQYPVGTGPQPQSTAPDFYQGPAFGPGIDSLQEAQQYQQFLDDLRQTEENLASQVAAGTLTPQQAAQNWEIAYSIMSGRSDAAQEALNLQMLSDNGLLPGMGDIPLREQAIQQGMIDGNDFGGFGQVASNFANYGIDFGGDLLNAAGSVLGPLYEGLQDTPFSLLQNPANPYTRDTATFGEVGAISTPYREEISDILGQAGRYGLEYLPYAINPLMEATSYGAEQLGLPNLSLLQAIQGLRGDIGEFGGENLYPQNLAQASLELLPVVGSADDLLRIASRGLDELAPYAVRLLRDETGSIEPDDIARAFRVAREAEGLTPSDSARAAYHGVINAGGTAEEAQRAAAFASIADDPAKFSQAQIEGTRLTDEPPIEAFGDAPLTNRAPGPERNINDVFGDVSQPQSTPPAESFNDFLTRSRTDPELQSQVADVNRRNDEAYRNIYGEELTPAEREAAPVIQQRIEEASRKLADETPPPSAGGEFAARSSYGPQSGDFPGTGGEFVPPSRYSPETFNSGRWGPEDSRWNPETGRWEPTGVKPEDANPRWNAASGRWESPHHLAMPTSSGAPGDFSPNISWMGDTSTYGPNLPTAKDLKPSDVGIWDWLQLFRGLLSGGEMSGGITHLGMQAASHPVKWADAMATGVRALAEPDTARAIDHSFKNESLHGRLEHKYNADAHGQPRAPSTRANQNFSPVYMNYVGGSMNQRQEEFASRLINNIGAFGIHPYEIAARGSATMFNAFRSSLQDDFIARLIDMKGGAPGNLDVLSKADLDLIKRNASWIDASTGWGHMGKFEDISTHLGQILFSPRYLFSQAERAAYMVPTHGFDAVWRDAVKTHVNFLATGSAALATAAALGIGEVQTNPNHIDFGKITIDVPGTDAKQTFNIWGPYQPLARMLAQVATGEYSYSGQQRDYFTGQVKDYEGKGDTSPLRAFSGWFLNKASPQANILLDILGSGKLGVKDKVPEEWQKTLWPEYKDLDLNFSSLMKIATPILVQDIYKAAEKEGLSSALRAGAAGFIGLSSQTRTPGDPFLFPEQRAQQNVLDTVEGLVAAGVDPNLAKMIAGEAFVDLGSKEKRDVLAGVGPEKLSQFAEDARQRGSEFQASIDQQNAIRQEYAPRAENLLNALLSGQLDPYTIRKAASALEIEMNEKLYKVDFPEGKGEPRFKSEIQQLEATYRKLADSPAVKNADGTMNHALLGQLQSAMIKQVYEEEPNLGTRLAYNTQKEADSRDPSLFQIYDRPEVRQLLNTYNSVGPGEKDDWRRENPADNAYLYLLGYNYTLESPEALQRYQQLSRDPDPKIDFFTGYKNEDFVSYANLARQGYDVTPYQQLSKTYFETPEDQRPDYGPTDYLRDHPQLNAVLFNTGHTGHIYSVQAWQMVQGK